jgi:hypothetical protein
VALCPREQIAEKATAIGSSSNAPACPAADAAATLAGLDRCAAAPIAEDAELKASTTTLNEDMLAILSTRRLAIKDPSV